MTTPYRLDGKVALITGASRGLGRGFALTLARAGAAVAVTGRDMERLGALGREITEAGGHAEPIALDVTDAAAVTAGVAAAEEALGPLDILVNNSGVAVTKPALEVSEADWDYVVDTNLKGTWLVAQAVAKGMAARGAGGRIINIASIASSVVLGQLSAYCASKAAVAHLTRALAVEWARHEIQVNAIAPGYIETDMNKEFFASAAGQALIHRDIPQRRIGQPEDLDGALLLLASDASRFMTGAIIAVDGGHAVA
jgi:NAD(P)-dependent dehydrogenase (short-subunit alcohol dehydrogenase family)